MSSKLKVLKKSTAIMVVVAMGVFQSLMASTVLAQVTPKLTGDLSVRGSVSLNGASAANGATVFDGGMIKTAANGIAIVNLGRLGQVELSGDSELVLKISDGVIGGNLRAGRAMVNAPAGVAINILTADGVAISEGKDASSMTVDVTCGNTKVASARSEARVTAGDRVEVVAAGQEVSVGAPQDNSRCPRMAAATGAAAATSSVSGAALAALIILGLGGAVAGVVAATQGDDGGSSFTGTLSNFR